MSTNRHSVMIVSLSGLTSNLVGAIDSALEADLDPVVLVPATTVTQLRQILSEQLDGERQPQVSPLRVHTFGRIRSLIRHGVTRIGSVFGRSMRRIVRAIRVRTNFGKRRGDSLLQLERRVEAFPTEVASSLTRVLVDLPLGMLGRAITELQNIASLRRTSLRLGREGMLIGVICLDGKALIPGWYISRMSPTTPVLTAYPDDWTRRLISEIEQFEKGPRWI